MRLSVGQRGGGAAEGELVIGAGVIGAGVGDRKGLGVIETGGVVGDRKGAGVIETGGVVGDRKGAGVIGAGVGAKKAVGFLIGANAGDRNGAGVIGAGVGDRKGAEVLGADDLVGGKWGVVGLLANWVGAGVRRRHFW